MLTPEVDILEVTLRDGSYLIDFQFTAEDTAVIAAALQEVGFRWIEVGHGVGLGGGKNTRPLPAASDEEYLEAAASVLDKAKWGMFFIPGVGQDDDLRLAARYGMKFVRIGTNVTQSEQARSSVELAKELGLIVSYNAMKSYAVSPEEFARRAAEARSWGVDVVCLVDSAGSFDGDTIARYIRAVREASDVAIGFHGHDNLSMAVANSIRAVEEGAVLVDASLQGMGRSAGNAITEILIGVLQQRGLVPHLDLKDTMDVGMALIQPLLGRRGIDPLAVTAGLARFHSSFMPKVAAYARRHDIDVRDLIVRLTQADQISAPDDLLEELSRDLAAKKMPHVIDIPLATKPRSSAPTPQQSLAALLRGLRSHAVKYGKFATLNIVRNHHDHADAVVSRNIESTPSHVIGVVAVASPAQLDAVLAAAREMDVVLLDVDAHPRFASFDVEAARSAVAPARLLTYLDSDVWVRAVESQIVRLLGEAAGGAAVAIAGEHRNTKLLAARLERRGARIVNDTAAARVVVVWPNGKPETIGPVAAESFVIDAAVGGLSADAIESVRTSGAHLLRVNMWPEIAGAIVAAHEAARVVDEVLGWGTIAEVPVVSGGVIGRRGDVIVDSVRVPTRVIGVADGSGGVLFDAVGDDDQRVRRVSEEITRRQLSAH